jgi:hypothetical protein
VKHQPLADFKSGDRGSNEAGLTPPQLDSLSRDLAVTAARLPDQRLRLLAAMQLLGNLRDYLVADISESAEQAIDQAIKALMRHERELPSDWTA